MEKRANNFGNYFNQWYDKTFNIAGPLIGAFIGLIIIRIIIYIIQTFDAEIFIVTALSEGLYQYLLIIFASLILTGYNTYFYKKYKGQYQWIYPMISAIGFVIGAWIAGKILLIISESNETPIIEAVGNFIDTYIVVLFVLAIIIGYAYQFAFGPYQTKR